jgi:hypothetical protein
MFAKNIIDVILFALDLPQEEIEMIIKASYSGSANRQPKL